MADPLYSLQEFQKEKEELVSNEIAAIHGQDLKKDLYLHTERAYQISVGRVSKDKVRHGKNS